ncbi:hypothetical protein [Sphingomonas ginsenosidimutans]|uniref:hypothetical protein n=2 Tax=Sphingomonas TaxID=13687 RepID=UPI001DC64552|nr:hypothetical protein [Sphingomonas ginsenosidimutans]MBY0300496.1 hypothetical protein [Sphingomonas ginsenosidimutans]
MRGTFLAASGAMLLTGCVSGSALSTDLSARPVPSPQTEDALIEVLAESLEQTGTRTDADGKSRPIMTFREPRDAGEIKRYLAAGFALTDIYCDRFFRETNAAMRRRKFGRALTNDVGTAVGSVLGLITSVPKAVVSGTSAVTGGLDSTWRNYEDSFVVSPELESIRSLVLAAQDDYRQQTYREAFPADYMTARSAVVRYAGLCSFLGMKALLNQSVDQRRNELVKLVDPRPSPTPAPPPPPPPAAVVAPAAAAPETEGPAARAGLIPPG